MVKGLKLFADHFKGFEDSYILIGGSACDLWMQRFGLPFRSTKDLDIVIVIEALNSAFVKKFWDFVRLAGYQTVQKGTGERAFYRFQKPAKEGYPFMLELFAKSPFLLEPVKSLTLITPIPAGDDASSLSAILMDEGYYGLVMSNRFRENELSLPVIPAIAIIPLKAKAWLDLTARREAGEHVDEKDIKKHRNDIFRLSGTLTEDTRVVLPESVAADMQDFISKMQDLPGVESQNISKSISVKTFEIKAALDRLISVYQMSLS